MREPIVTPDNQLAGLEPVADARSDIHDEIGIIARIRRAEAAHWRALV